MHPRLLSRPKNTRYQRPHPRDYPLVWSFLVNSHCGGIRFIGTTVTDTNVKGKPTNFEFIALIADKLQLQLKSSEVANF